MFTAMLCLLGCELAGELVKDAADLPIPGPVIGMFLLAALLGMSRQWVGAAIPPPLDKTAETLIDLMGVLFVPAGVGIIAEAGLLQQEWRPILAALLGSTVLSIAVTGLVMHWAMRVSRWCKRPAAAVPSLGGLRR